MIGIQAYLAFALVVFLLLPLGSCRPAQRVLAFGLVLLAGLIPLPWGIPLAGYLRGLTDDLAITTMIWLAAAVLVKSGLAPKPRGTTSLQLWLMFCALGLLLYPAAMGVGMLDPYRWGYSPRPLILGIGLLALLMLWLGNAMAALMLSLATVAYLLDLKQSDNYWDYLLDPFVAVYAVLASALYLLVKAYGSIRRFQTAAPASSRTDAQDSHS